MDSFADTAKDPKKTGEIAGVNLKRKTISNEQIKKLFDREELEPPRAKILFFSNNPMLFNNPLLREISCGLMGHLAHMQTLLSIKSIKRVRLNLKIPVTY